MAKRDIIVIGASAGGVEALVRLAAALPPKLDAAVFVTLHFPRTSQSVLPQLLNRAGPLKAVHPQDGERIARDCIYVAPPDQHLLVMRGQVRVTRGPTENGNRPAVDPMFRSAALAYGNRVIGVVLSGNLDDGTAGLHAIVKRGGVGVAQDPADAMFPSMPASVIEHGIASHVVALADLAPLLLRLLSEEIPEMPGSIMDDDAKREGAFAAFDMNAIEDPDHHPGNPSPYACPDCGGVLWGIQDGEMQRFRCRVGHAWTSDALLMQQTETLDSALWMALRALEENASLNRHMAERMRKRGVAETAERFERTAALAEQRAAVVRDALMAPRPGDAGGETRGAAVAIGITATAGKTGRT